jgi:hypothetical protein
MVLDASASAFYPCDPTWELFSVHTRLYCGKIDHHETTEDLPAAGEQPLAMSEMPIAYEETTTEDYARKAASEFTVAKIQDGIILRGPCPRCNHRMEYAIVQRIYRGGLSRSARMYETGAADVETVLCTCSFNHPGRPEDNFGCGAYWNVRVSSG